MCKQETTRAAFATGRAFLSASECGLWIASPFAELGDTCMNGAQITIRALKGFFRGCASGGELVYAAAAPYGQELYQTFTIGGGIGARFGGALQEVGHTGATIAQTALEGVACELIDLFVVALERAGKTGYAAQGSIKSWLSISKESSYRLLLEAADTFGVGRDECLRMSAALPPALQAFF